MPAPREGELAGHLGPHGAGGLVESNMTQNWKGIRVSAVLAILGSAAALLFAGLISLMAFFGVSTSDGTASLLPFKPAMLVMAGVCLALSAWGTATGIAIFLRRRWARTSMLVFAALLAFTNVGAMLFTLFVQLLIVFQNRPTEMAGWVAVGFNGVLGAIGVVAGAVQSKPQQRLF